MLYQQCYIDRTKFPVEKWIYPFKVLPNGDAVPNPDYTDAPYEMGYISLEKQVLHHATVEGMS